MFPELLAVRVKELTSLNVMWEHVLGPSGHKLHHVRERVGKELLYIPEHVHDLDNARVSLTSNYHVLLVYVPAFRNGVNGHHVM